MHAYYSGQFVLPLPEGHRFPMVKYAMLRDRIALELPDVAMLDAPRASDGELAMAHTPAYIAAIQNGTLSGPAMREIGFPWSPAMVERSRRSVGASVAAVRRALQGDGVSANLAGGTHHASADKGSGFCVFNDIAVAARLAQAEYARGQARQASGQLLKVAVIDLDVHQGNGTASIFKNDDSVFTLSVHGEKNFPYRKEPGDLDVDLPDGCADAEYLHALEVALDELARRFQPGLVIYLAGADPFEGDRLGRLKLSYDGLEARDRRVFDWCFTRHIPVALAMGGGYGVKIDETVQVQVNTYRVALGYWQRWRDRVGRGARLAGPQALAE
jgi:acetoin utilization deacetylase AcuC-like enzyme